MDDGERILRRLLRKASVTEFLARSCPDHLVTNAAGDPLSGDVSIADSSPAEIIIGGKCVGNAHGPRRDAIAETFGILAAQESETRALARESLDRYKELSMLYALAEKIVGARDASDIAVVVAREAQKYLACDSLSVYVLNSETGRLEVIAEVGRPQLDRTTRNIGNDLVASVLETGVGEIVNDASADPRGLELDATLQSVVCSPMKANERIFGVVVAGTSERRHFNAGDLQVMNALAAQAAAAVEVARLNRDLKASHRKPVDLIYHAEDRVPLGVALLLGIQHMLIALLTLAFPVLVAVGAGATRLEAANVVSMSLVAMAIGTVLQLRSGSWIGSGFLAPSITSAIFLAPSLLAAKAGGLPLVFGMTVFAGVVALILSQVLGRFRKLFPPEVSGVVVLMVGISLVPISVSHFLGLGDGDTASDPAEWLIGLLTLGTIVMFTVIRVGTVKLYATAIGLAVGYLASWVADLFDPQLFQKFDDLPLVGFGMIRWHGLAFDFSLALPFIAAALASNVKDAGLIITFQKANDVAWKRPDTASMSGGLMAGGLSNMIAGGLGGVGLGVSAGSVGLAIATGAMARNIGYVTALIFLILAFLPKVTAVLAVIPSPVLGAGLMYVACHLIASGVELIASRMLDARRIYVIGLPLLAGIGLIASPDLGTLFPHWGRAIVDSPLATTTILALVLNLILNVGVSSRASSEIGLDQDLPSSVARFLDRQGATWGARLDVINRAIPAITDMCDELRESLGRNRAFVDLSFDEFSLEILIRDTNDQPAQSKADAATTLDLSARTIARRYGCNAKVAEDLSVHLVFEH